MCDTRATSSHAPGAWNGHEGLNGRKGVTASLYVVRSSPVSKYVNR